MHQNLDDPKERFAPEYFYLVALCLIPVIAVFSPRALAVLVPATAVLSLCVFLFTKKRAPQFPLPLGGFLCLAFVYFLLSSFWSIHPGYTIEKSLKLLPIFTGGFLLIALSRSFSFSTHHAAFFFKWFLSAVILAGCVCIVELYFYAPYYHIAHGLTAFEDKKFNFSSLNRAVVFFILLAFISWYCLNNWKNLKIPKSLIFSALTILFALILLKTESQSAQMGLLIGLLFYFLFPINRLKAWRLLGGLLVSGLLFAPFLAQILFEFLLPHVEGKDWLEQGSAASRMEIWDFVADKALEKPLLGHGLGTTRYIEDFDNFMLFHDQVGVLHPHNFALQLWLETGLIGVGFASLLLVLILRIIYSTPPSIRRVLLATAMAAGLIASTAYGLWQGWWMALFFLLGAYGQLIIRLSDPSYLSKGLGNGKDSDEAGRV